MRLQPYVFFDGRCEQAVEFYKQAVGAEVEMLMHFRDAPDQSMVTPESKDKVMHCSLRIGESTLLVSDGRCTGQQDFKGFQLALTAKDDAEAKRLFDALSTGGTVQTPLAETFFASSFGTLTDKFGVGWIVLAERQ